jgi:hypothetical protein
LTSLFPDVVHIDVLVRSVLRKWDVLCGRHVERC